MGGTSKLDTPNTKCSKDIHFSRVVGWLWIFYFRILNLFRISYFDIRIFHCVYEPGTQNPELGTHVCEMDDVAGKILNFTHRWLSLSGGGRGGQ
jgi:hypothetical protein